MIEICCANLQSALNAEAGGADRIELCDNLWEGGTTPSAGILKVVKNRIKIPVFVLVRPRGGDFLYSVDEFTVMLEDIHVAKALGADGIVSGVLNNDGSVDCERTIQLIEAASPLPFTFHRAFDFCKNPDEALEDIIMCGAQRILTSGCSNSVTDGIGIISKLNKLANGRIIIIPGGGINSENIVKIRKESGCREFHLSAKKLYSSEMKYRKSELKLNGSKDIPENEIYISDADIIRNVISNLNKSNESLATFNISDRAL